jgi:hypothetical protein
MKDIRGDSSNKINSFLPSESINQSIRNTKINGSNTDLVGHLDDIQEQLADYGKEPTIKDATDIFSEEIMKSGYMRTSHLKKVILSHKNLNMKLLKELTKLVTPIYEIDKDPESDPQNFKHILKLLPFNLFDVQSGASLFHAGRPSVNVNIQSIQHQFKRNLPIKVNKKKTESDSEEDGDLWVKSRVNRKNITGSLNESHFCNHMDELQSWDSIDMKSDRTSSEAPASNDCHNIIFPRNRQRMDMKYSPPVPLIKLGGLGADKDSETYQKGVYIYT